MPDHPERKSPRLAAYDYAQEGVYFVTVCVQHRMCLLGRVVDGTLFNSPAGEMVGAWWQKLPGKFPGAALDEFIVMPNHFHGLVIIDAPPSAQTRIGLPTMMQWFKAMTTNAYIRGVKVAGWPSFDGKLWQRSYHDHIVRSEHSLNTIQQYVQENPARWTQDTFFAGTADGQEGTNANVSGNDKGQ